MHRLKQTWLVSLNLNRYSKVISVSYSNALSLFPLLFRGGVGERLKPPVLKTGVHFVDREFESRPLRQSKVLFAGAKNSSI
jgi:hypothetical protein